VSASSETRYVTTDGEEREAFELYRLCDCDACNGTGKEPLPFGVVASSPRKKCRACRGEGRIHELIAAATDAESVGVALVTLGREGEWDDCPIGVLEVNGEPGRKWLVRPWKASAREVSAAGRTLRQAQEKK
jgi:hypothetical protein